MVSSVRNNSTLYINSYFLGRTHGAAPNTISNTNLRPASSPTLLPLDTPAQAKITRAMGDLKTIYSQLKPAPTGLELSKTDTTVDKRNADINNTSVLTAFAKDRAKQTTNTIGSKPPTNTAKPFTAAMTIDSGFNKTPLTNMAKAIHDSSPNDLTSNTMAEKKEDITTAETKNDQNSVDDPESTTRSSENSPVNDSSAPLSPTLQTQLDQYRNSTFSAMFGNIYSPGLLLDLYA